MQCEQGSDSQMQSGDGQVVAVEVEDDRVQAGANQPCSAAAVMRIVSNSNLDQLLELSREAMQLVADLLGRELERNTATPSTSLTAGMVPLSASNQL